MEHRINKERTWLFAPSAMIASMVEVHGSAEIREIKEAVESAIQVNGMLHTRVSVNQECAYFEEDSPAQVSFQVTKEPYERIMKQQEKIPFHLERGEYLRVFVLTEGTDMTEEKWKLLILSHHLAGDGMSYAYLIQDIMKALSRDVLNRKPVQLFDMESLPKESSLNPMMKLLM